MRQASIGSEIDILLRHRHQRRFQAPVGSDGGGVDGDQWERRKRTSESDGIGLERGTGLGWVLEVERAEPKARRKVWLEAR